MRMVKKENLPTKICLVCQSLFLGEENGNLSGMKSNTVPKDVSVIKI
jgi:hypothetical protein